MATDVVFVPSTPLLVSGVDRGESADIAQMRADLEGLVAGTVPTLELSAAAREAYAERGVIAVGLGGAGVERGARLRANRLESLSGEDFRRADLLELPWADAVLLTVMADLGVRGARVHESEGRGGPRVAALDLCPDDRPDSPVPFDPTSAVVNDACRAVLEAGDRDALLELSPRVARSGGSLEAARWLGGPARIVADTAPAGVRYLVAIAPCRQGAAE